MTAKEFVKSKMPKARAEKHKEGRIKGLQRTYWLIRDGREYFYFANGDTESKAWKKAKEKLLKIDLEKK